MGEAGLKIAVAPCHYPPHPKRDRFIPKTLLFAEREMLDWVLSAGALPLTLPMPARVPSEETLGRWLEGFDGLLLQGGADVAPESYGQAPLRPEWAGDAARDAYEIALLKVAMGRGLPVLGVCRGLQIMNVALGGTMVQDIPTQRPEAGPHRSAERYDALTHDMVLEPGGWLAGLYPEAMAAGGVVRINSVHHQALDRLGEGVVVDARAAGDGMIEAAYVQGAAGFAAGVQFHPEWCASRSDVETLDVRPILESFLDAARA